MRILALGDSYTIGEGVEAHDRWPNQLARILRSSGVETDDPHILAQTAWTTDELFDAISAEKPRGPFDFVILLVGVNDQYRSREVASFAAEYKRLLRRVKALARNSSKRALALSIPDWGSTPFAEGRDRERIGREIEAYNAKACELAETAGVRWMDITTMSRGMRDDPALVTADGLHPSGALYKRWAEAMAPIALALR